MGEEKWDPDPAFEMVKDVRGTILLGWGFLYHARQVGGAGLVPSRRPVPGGHLLVVTGRPERPAVWAERPLGHMTPPFAPKVTGSRGTAARAPEGPAALPGGALSVDDPGDSSSWSGCSRCL